MISTKTRIIYTHVMRSFTTTTFAEQNIAILHLSSDVKAE